MVGSTLTSEFKSFPSVGDGSVCKVIVMQVFPRNPIKANQDRLTPVISALGRHRQGIPSANCLDRLTEFSERSCLIK